MNPDLIDAMFVMHGVRGPWAPLRATGVANRIYATADIVLRVATDHPDAVADARTESVAAPVARAAGIPTPRLIAFDDSRTLVDRPFSLWERVNGETFGLLELDPPRMAATWREVGRELSRLHHRVSQCPDPAGYLDMPGRPLDLDSLLKRLTDADRVDAAAEEQIARLISELAPHVTPVIDLRFIHDDIDAMNIMCSPDGALLAIIDWGDAGWGDPTLDFAAIPLDSIPDAVEGYETETPGALGELPEARFIWDKLHYAMEESLDNGGPLPPVDPLYRYLRSKVGYLHRR